MVTCHDFVVSASLVIFSLSSSESGLTLVIGRAIALLVVAAAVLPCTAGPIVLDQSYYGTRAFSPAIATNFEWAQSVVVGSAGTIERIGVQIYRNPFVTNPPTLSVYRTDAAGEPVWEAVFEMTIPIAEVPLRSQTSRDPEPTPMTLVSLSSESLAVESGEQILIGLSREGAGAPPWLVWVGGYTDTYIAGRPYVNQRAATAVDVGSEDFDLGFEVFIRVPEPATSAIALSLFGWLCPTAGRARSASAQARAER